MNDSEDLRPGADPSEMPYRQGPAVPPRRPGAPDDDAQVGLADHTRDALQHRPGGVGLGDRDVVELDHAVVLE